MAKVGILQDAKDADPFQHIQVLYAQIWMD